MPTILARLLGTRTTRKRNLPASFLRPSLGLQQRLRVLVSATTEEKVVRDHLPFEVGAPVAGTLRLGGSTVIRKEPPAGSGGVVRWESS